MTELKPTALKQGMPKVVEMAHIEPMFSEKDQEAAVRLRDAAYKARTGENALDLGGDFE